MKQETKQEILAVVGSTYDITGIAVCDAIMNDSNPSKVYGGSGGAGRNVAENVARMGIKTGIISAYGTDTFSNVIIDANKRAGMDVSRCYIKQDASSCMYISLLDRNGELLLAAADLSLIEQMPVEHLKENQDYINSFENIFVDTNLTEEMLVHIAESTKARLYADTVSMNKAVRLRPIIKRMECIKTNRGELGRLTGCDVDDMESVKHAAQLLVDEGAKRVYVTMGAQGSCCLDREGFSFLPSCQTEVKNVTGAGDAFAAACIYGSLHRVGREETLLLGTAAAHIALQSQFAVNEEMSEESLLSKADKLRRIRGQAE